MHLQLQIYEHFLRWPLDSSSYRLQPETRYNTDNLFQIAKMGCKPSKKQRSRVTEEEKRIFELTKQRDKLIQCRNRVINKTDESDEVKDETLEKIDDNLGELEQKILDLELHQVRENVQTIIQPFVRRQQNEKKQKRFGKIKKRETPVDDAEEAKRNGPKRWRSRHMGRKIPLGHIVIRPF